MQEVFLFIVMPTIIYVVYKLALKEPLIPGRKKKQSAESPMGNPKLQDKKKKGKNSHPLDELEAAPFKELFEHVFEMKNHMIHHYDNTFTMITEVEPVNYFLLDEEEQGAIDAAVETWLAQIEYPVRIYLQNRFVDLTLPIQEMQDVMRKEDDLEPAALEFGQNMVKNLTAWQNSQPRYETKRYLIFDYQIDLKEIKADSVEEFEEKMIDKAFKELHRRVSTAQSQLQKADMEVMLLSTDGIAEVMYYGFNRRKALKNRYRDIERQEQLSLYVTADQTAKQIILVKGELENVQKEEEQERTAG